MRSGTIAPDLSRQIPHAIHGRSAQKPGASLSEFRPFSASTRTTVPGDRRNLQPHSFMQRHHEIRRELYEAYRWFVAAYRTAAEKLGAGDPTARFPAGSFPPALPFVAV
ncbi:MAG: hypothetical protein WAM82_05000 [Thermoanaerobaculia bacterium]